MAKMSKATLQATSPRNTSHRLEFTHSDGDTQFAKDIADGLRAKGYKVTVRILKEVEEEY